MKFPLVLLMACLCSVLAVPTSGSLKGGSGSFSGGTGQSSVLFTTGVVDPSGSFSVVNSGASPYRLSSSKIGDTWTYVTGTVTTTCPGFGPGVGGTGIVSFRKVSGAILGQQLVIASGSPATFKFAVNDVTSVGDSYELTTGNGVLGGSSCTTSVSNARFTMSMPIVN